MIIIYRSLDYARDDILYRACHFDRSATARSGEIYHFLIPHSDCIKTVDKFRHTLYTKTEDAGARLKSAELLHVMHGPFEPVS